MKKKNSINGLNFPKIRVNKKKKFKNCFFNHF